MNVTYPLSHRRRVEILTVDPATYWRTEKYRSSVAREREECRQLLTKRNLQVSALREADNFLRMAQGKFDTTKFVK